MSVFLRSSNQKRWELSFDKKYLGTAVSSNLFLGAGRGGLCDWTLDESFRRSIPKPQFALGVFVDQSIRLAHCGGQKQHLPFAVHLEVLGR
jgi:hypothetical protein